MIENQFRGMGSLSTKGGTPLVLEASLGDHVRVKAVMIDGTRTVKGCAPPVIESVKLDGKPVWERYLPCRLADWSAPHGGVKPPPLLVRVPPPEDGQYRRVLLSVTIRSEGYLTVSAGLLFDALTEEELRELERAAG